MTTTRQRAHQNNQGHPTPTKGQLLRIADIYFKVALLLCFFLLPFVLLLRTPDTALFISTFTLAIAIPLLILSITSTYVFSRMANSSLVLGISGSVSCVIALTALFWHLSWIAGVAFLAAIFIGDVIMSFLD